MPPTWFVNGLSPNYAYLGEDFHRPQTTPFTLTSDLIKRFVSDLHFHPVRTHVLFGLRACAMVDPHQQGRWCSQVALYETDVDHQHSCCILGVWRITDNKLCVLTGSTVPNSEWMRQQAATIDQPIANLLSLGLYRYRVGAHEPAHYPAESGAYILDKRYPVPVWRDMMGSGYTLASQLDICIPADNIHAAGLPARQLSPHVSFSSAGCQTLVGSHSPPADPIGAYQAFRLASGQTAHPHPVQVNQPFCYILTTARHLAMLAEHPQHRYPFLMFGSQGKMVQMLHQHMIEQGLLADHPPATPIFNGQTTACVYAWQRAQHLIADGIIKPSDAQRLGFTLK